MNSSRIYKNRRNSRWIVKSNFNNKKLQVVIIIKVGSGWAVIIDHKISNTQFIAL